MNKEELMESARNTKKAAYAPYSKFPVGAALLLKDGNVINGVNVENVSLALLIVQREQQSSQLLQRAILKVIFRL